MSNSEDAEDIKLKLPPNEENNRKEDEQLLNNDAVQKKSSELSDPAILAIGEGLRHRYTKEELMQLRLVPLAMKPPTFIEEIVPSIYDPERNSGERKKSVSPTENVTRDPPETRGRKSGDPRERVRKENDGIVLSPQRRSFNSGCFVSIKEQPPMARPNRAHSPLGKGEAQHTGPTREIPTNSNRRIGSGRILRDSCGDTYDKNEQERGGDEQPYQRWQMRGFNREYDNSKEKDQRRSGGRYSEHRRRISGGEKDEEPEWFSSGPMSQNDTIELRGFEESDKMPIMPKKKLSASQAKRVREWAKRKGEGAGSQDDRNDDSVTKQHDGKVKNRTPSPKCNDDGEDKENQKNGALGAAGDVINENSFIFDDLFKCDSITGLLANGGGGEGDSTKSRFSRWFKRESPESGKHHQSTGQQSLQTDSRRSSLHEDHHLLKNLLNDLNEPAALSIPQQQGPGDADSYFAPISPAAPNSATANAARQIDIAEIFKRGQPNNGTNFNKFPGKVMSLNELETRIRKGIDVPPAGMSQINAQKQDEEMSAFKRLLAQVSGGHVVTANNTSMPQSTRPPMSLMEMLSHSQQQDEAHARLNMLANAGGPQQQASPKASSIGTQQLNELAMKMQQAQELQRQQQYNQLNKILGVQQQVRSSPLADLNHQQCRELLNRPEAQAILQGLKRGDITTQHLYQQLANPALQPRHRDLLCAILKVLGFGPSPRGISPVPPSAHAIFGQQQLRVSPLPNAIHQRIPSPRELQVHTQNILQRALIKKKLEEQQENYRKKQEMQQQQRSHSPNPQHNNNNIKNVSSPTPLAFTPTSVLRKMTAEKEDGNKEIKSMEMKIPQQGRAVTGARMPTSNQWAQFQMKQPAGRPIVKANTGYQNVEQFFSSTAQQQHLFNQQQQQQQRLPPMQQQQHAQKGIGGMISGNQYHGGNMPNPMYSGNSHQQYPQLTQQQLRAQHQQQARPANQPAQSQQQQPSNNAWQQFLNAAQQQNATPRNPDKMSPSSNDQFARWFSPDLLERARGGELPSTAGLGQHALSLEEIERQAAPPVHN